MNYSQNTPDKFRGKDILNKDLLLKLLNYHIILKIKNSGPARI